MKKTPPPHPSPLEGEDLGEGKSKFLYNKIRKKFLWFVLVVLLLLFTRKYLAQLFFVLGKSMEPTIKDRRICLINKAIYHFRLPKREEIVVFRTTEEPPLYFTKRIVGLPGEIVEIKEGKLFINGRHFPEPWTTINQHWNLKRTEVKENCFFVIGDNRSIDLSRHLHGQVALRNIIGRVK